MIRLTRSQLLPIGLDIGQDGVRLLQLEVVQGAGPSDSPTLSVAASARYVFPLELRENPDAGPDVRLAAAAPVIKQLLKQHRFRGTSVVTALPREKIVFKNLRLPLMPAAELDGAIRFEARNIFPFDTDLAHVDYLPAGEVRQGGDVRQEVIVAAAKNEDVDQLLEHLHRCGVVVDSLDLEPCALFRSVERFIRRREDEAEVQVLLDVGSRTSQMVIGRGREVSFLKTIEIGGRDLNEAVALRLSITREEARTLRRKFVETSDSADPRQRDPVRQAVYDATRSTIETLGRELAMCLRYHSVTFRGQRPTRVRLLGGESGDAQLRMLLTAAINIPVEVGRPLYSININTMKPQERRGTLGEWGVALGLALKTTRCRFAPRDGKPRSVPTSQPDASGVEINTLDTPVDAEPAPSARARVEVAHA